MASRRGIAAAGWFLLGLALFGYLVGSFGLRRILDQILLARGGVTLAVLLWGAIYLLNALSWKLALGPAGAGLGFGRLFRVTVSGFAINYITPFVALGGEPYRARALSGDLGPARAISAVVLYRMVHLLGHMLLLLAGIVTAFLTVRMSPPVALSLGAAAAACASVVALALKGTREGVFDRIARFVGRHRRLAFLARPLGRYRGELAEMDAVLTGVARNDGRGFLASVGVEFLSRVLMGVEVWVVLLSLGAAVSLPQAMFVYVTYSVAINLLFFIPMNFGAREGGILLGVESLSIDPSAAIALAVILRIREFLWIAAGLSLTLFGARTGGAGGASPAAGRAEP